MERNWSMFTPYVFTKNLEQIHLRDSHVKFTGKNKFNMSHEQVNYLPWLFKNDKTVYSDTKRKISLPVSGEQASKNLASGYPFLDFQPFRLLVE